MGQYTDRVDRQRDMLEAEKWAKGVKSLHAHSLDSMAYAIGRKDGRVCDIQYNSGLIERTIRATGEIIYFGKQLKGQDLLDTFSKAGNNRF